MDIDRSRFFFLTASIAGLGSACGAGAASTTSSGGPVPVVAEPVVALPAEPFATTDKDGRSTGKNATPEDAEVGEDDGTMAALALSGSTGSDNDLLSCDDSGAAPKSCKPLRAPGPQCESFADTVVLCGRMSKGLRPRVAEKAVDCLLAKSGKQSICDFRAASECALSAIRKACVEPTTQSLCATPVKACGGRLSMKDCQSLLSAVKSNERRAMISCVTEGCSIDYCMYDIE